MKKNRRKNGKKLRLMPLALGIYAVLLGLGLFAAAADSWMKDATAVAALRLLGGLGLACIGLYGVWDGVRDLFKPDKPEPEPARQYILTDVQGQRSSNVTAEGLRAQLEALAESETSGSFHLTALPPLPIPGLGELRQISGVHDEPLTLIAFLDTPDGGHLFRQRSADPDTAAEILLQFLSGSLDLTDWAVAHLELRQEEAVGRPRQLLRIWGESWRNDLKFFSLRDVELAVDGLADGKYHKVELELGAALFILSPSLPDESLLAVRLLLRDSGRAFAKAGTPTQVKFWLVRILGEGQPVELQGWQDITPV